MLTDAESSKHRLLVEAVRRRVAARPGGDRILMEAAYQLLSDVEEHSPEVVAGLLSLPQIGGWAVDCLRRIAADEGGEDEIAAHPIPLSGDLGYLAAVAAAAGLRTRHPFDLSVPLRDGRLLLPSLGLADLGLADPQGVARVRLDADGAVVLSNGRAVVLPTGADLESGRSSAHWRPTPRLRAGASGVVLDVLLDPFDPFLASVGDPATSLSGADHAAWQLNVGEAWRILVRHHRATAEAIAATVSTVVPQAVAAANSDPKSATSGWTFGAIGLSLPRDTVSLAEMFVHEYQHLVLGAVEDLSPLVVADRDGQLSYAPWRDDPRPASGLLHGCYAYLGVTGFWRRQRRIGDPAERFRGSAEFARWRLATLDAATRLVRSPALTETGRGFAAGIRDQLARWQAEPVPAEAERLAGDVRTEHRVRWRLNNLRPANAQIGALAHAWLSGTSAAPDRVGTTVERAKPALEPARARLLEARYRDPARIRRLIGDGEGYPDGISQSVDEADLALLNGDRLTAIRGYRRRLEAADDLDAWVGLAVAMRLADSPACASLLAARPEIVAAVYAHVREVRGEVPDPSQLVEWLAEHFATREEHRAGDDR